MTRRKGLYFGCDGGEGGGKTTIVRRVTEELRSRGVPVCAVREPGGTPVGDAVRVVLLDPAFTGQIDAVEELLLMYAARNALMRTVVLPALDAGMVCFTDRTAGASFVYQLWARGRMDLLPLLEVLNKQIVIWPDILFIFDLDPVVGLERVSRRGEKPNRLDVEEFAFHVRVREGFREFAKIAPCPVRIIDASRSQDEVYDEVWKVVCDIVEERTP